MEEQRNKKEEKYKSLLWIDWKQKVKRKKSTGDWKQVLDNFFVILLKNSMKVRNNKFLGGKTFKAKSSSMHHRLEEKKVFRYSKIIIE